MSTLKVVVQGGQAVINNLDEYPDGTELELVVVENENDEMSEEERGRLRNEIALSLEEARSGELFEAHDVIAELRSRL